MDANYLRRVKEKLKILTETPNINWVLNDLISIVDNDEEERARKACMEEGLEVEWSSYSEKQQIEFIQKLKEVYLMYIARNSSTPPTQKELEL